VEGEAAKPFSQVLFEAGGAENFIKDRVNAGHDAIDVSMEVTRHSSRGGLTAVSGKPYRLRLVKLTPETLFIEVGDLSKDLLNKNERGLIMMGKPVDLRYQALIEDPRRPGVEYPFDSPQGREVRAYIHHAARSEP